MPAHGLAPQNLSSDKHVDVCADSDEDRGSTPLASSLRSQRSGERRLSCRSLRRRTHGVHRTGLLRATARQASKKTGNFTYVYILQSQNNPEHFYTGSTNNLRARLSRHNRGNVPHTAKWKPSRIKTYIGFSNLKRAAQFEHYLKSASGRAFLKKHLWNHRRQTPLPGAYGAHLRPDFNH